MKVLRINNKFFGVAMGILVALGGFLITKSWPFGIGLLMCALILCIAKLIDVFQSRRY